jgi:hypothetical protein
MKFKTALFQNILLVIGVSAIFKFLSLRSLYWNFQRWESGMPVIDGEGIVLKFMGVPLLPFNDEGLHWTNAVTVGNNFLIFGVILILISIGILLRTRSKSRINNN